jgi:hypothetical protein
MRPFVKLGLVVALLSPLASGCASPPVAGPLTYAHCPLDAHTEAFPKQLDARRAFACRSNQSGFLSRDQYERMTPL